MGDLAANVSYFLLLVNLSHILVLCLHQELQTREQGTKPGQ